MTTKLLIITIAVFCLQGKTSAQFEGFRNAWRQSVQKLESYTLPPITIGNFELIPAQSQKEEDITQGPSFDYDDLVEVHEVTTSHSEAVGSQEVSQSQSTVPSLPIRQRVEYSQSSQRVNPPQLQQPFEYSQISQGAGSSSSQFTQEEDEFSQLRETSEAPGIIQIRRTTQAPPTAQRVEACGKTQAKGTCASLDIVIQKLTSIESKVDKLQEELHGAQQTIQQQSQQLQQCACGSQSQVRPEEDLSIYARAGTTPQPQLEALVSTPGQQQAVVTQAPQEFQSSQISQAGQTLRQMRQSTAIPERIQAPATLPPYPQLYISQSTRRSTPAPPVVEDEDHQESQWYRDHSIQQVQGNRHRQPYQHVNHQAFVESSEEIQGFRTSAVNNY